MTKPKTYYVTVPPALPAGEYTAHLEPETHDTLVLRPGSQIAVVPADSSLTPDPLADFRALRLFHWKRARIASATINNALAAMKNEAPLSRNYEYFERQQQVGQNAWSMHMRYVQALNQMFDTPKGDTAERDEEREKELAQSKRDK